MRIGLLLEYDGTDLHGSQLQSDVRTVQGEVETALASLFGRPIRLHLASRTDAGVHATGQVGAFNIETGLPLPTVRKALNHHLPRDVAVVHVAEVTDGFNPRRDAQSREYRYTIYNRPSRSPCLRWQAAHIRARLDDAAMLEAADRLAGEHDFASFAGPATPADAITVRRIEHVSLTRDDDRVTLQVRGNSFLHQQVRRIVGSLVRVGRADMDGGAFGELIARAKRGAARDLAPARGLCLTKVNYSDADESGLPCSPAETD